MNLLKVERRNPFFFICLQDAEDLSFRRGEILVVVEKNEENWWTAVNELGNKGLIPQPYVKRVGSVSRRQNITRLRLFLLGNFKAICLQERKAQRFHGRVGHPPSS